MLDGSNSVFNLLQPDAEIHARLAGMDVHPTGPLWGSGESIASGEARALEERALADCSSWCRGLEAAGLKRARRALRVPAAEIDAAFENAQCLTLCFALPAGAYATMLMRELLSFDGV